MTKLSVNINKIALIRNSRGGNIPDLLRAALDCEAFGADGITVHPRPDERHVRYSDVRELKKHIRTELNVEGYPSQRFMELVLSVVPAQVTLVPDEPGQLTSDHGWDTLAHADFLQKIIARLKARGIRTSLFVDTRPEMIEGAASLGTDRVELYTEPYAAQYPAGPAKALANFAAAARLATEAGIGLNAGHDLNLDNLGFFCQNVDGLLEVSIGHALVADALYYGLENTIQMYKGHVIK